MFAAALLCLVSLQDSPSTLVEYDLTISELEVTYGSHPRTALALNGGIPGPLLEFRVDDCIVTDNALGSMGDPVVIEYEGREIKFCCAPCEEEFFAEPAKYLAKLDAR